MVTPYQGNALIHYYKAFDERFGDFALVEKRRISDWVEPGPAEYGWKTFACFQGLHC
jgi:hypothetical protein